MAHYILLSPASIEGKIQNGFDVWEPEMWSGKRREEKDKAFSVSYKAHLHFKVAWLKKYSWM